MTLKNAFKVKFKITNFFPLEIIQLSSLVFFFLENAFSSYQRENIEMIYPVYYFISNTLIFTTTIQCVCEITS